MIIKLIAMYPQSTSTPLILDGAGEQDEEKIIENVCMLTGMLPTKVRKLINKCKKLLKNTYQTTDLEEHVLAAANMIRRMDTNETIRD